MWLGFRDQIKVTGRNIGSLLLLFEMRIFGDDGSREIKLLECEYLNEENKIGGI